MYKSTQQLLNEVEHEIKHGNTNRSPDHYYYLKDLARELRAELAGTTANKLDPVGFWYGGQSN